MKPIENWNEIQEAKTFERLPVGGYVCAIKAVEDVPDKQYLKIYFDIVKGEKKGYFQNEYDRDTRPQKKWAQAGTFIRSYKDSAASMFKGFINAVEASNKNFTWNWDEKSLVKKYVGLVIGEEEYVNQKGAVRVRNYVVGIHKTETIESGDFKMPELKKLTVSTTTVNNSSQTFVDPFANDSVAAKTASANTDNPWGDETTDPFA